MVEPFYSQRSLHVEIYAARTAGMPAIEGDGEFYLELARSVPGPPLELGCGAGRLLVSLAREGIEVTGLDRSQPMLEVAAEFVALLPAEVQQLVHLVAGDMTNFELGREFGLIYVAFRSFMMLTTPEEQRACLDRCLAQLVPGGLLAIDIFDPRLDRLTPEYEVSEPIGMGLIPHPKTFNLVSVEVIDRTNDPVNQVFEEHWRFTEGSRDGNILRREVESLRMRWTYRNEMRYLLELAGFEVLAEYSDYFKSPPAYGKEQIWVARKPG